ncbi:MAG: PDDEXK nuclease domain-containing protein [Muribaculum sp.]|nr:PDDEXK nuclease domain-containing protein [Muribaculum sp.]
MKPIKTDNIENNQLLSSVSSVIESARNTAYRQINESLVRRNWEIGKLIAEEELRGQNRAEYGLEIIKFLAKRLTAKYGRGFTKSYLYGFLNFYKFYPNIFQSVIGKSEPLLSWTHYYVLVQELNADARKWYENEVREHGWSTRELQRNINSQYYFRTLKTQQQELVKHEGLLPTKSSHPLDPTEFIKNPVIGEFLGFTADSSFYESELEQAIIDNLEKFILEMGKGFAFVARQQHIHTEKEDYYIDLVFYNYILKSFVLIDLKVSKVRHQDVGQMDMYVRMYDELKRTKGDNPTIGIILCAETDEDIARYSVLHDNDHLYASKFMTYMPTPEQLRAEIERQKAIFYLQQSDEKEN